MKKIRLNTTTAPGHHTDVQVRTSLPDLLRNILPLVCVEIVILLKSMSYTGLGRGAFSPISCLTVVHVVHVLPTYKVMSTFLSTCMTPPTQSSSSGHAHHSYAPSGHMGQGSQGHRMRAPPPAFNNSSTFHHRPAQRY